MGAQGGRHVCNAAGATEFVQRAMLRRPQLGPEGEQALWTLWRRSGDRVKDAALAKSIALTESRQFDLALAELDELTASTPGWAEPFNQRATVRYLQDEFAAALDDVQETLRWEPHHFGALGGSALVRIGLWRATPGGNAGGREHLVAARKDLRRVLQLYGNAQSAPAWRHNLDRLEQLLEEAGGGAGGDARAAKA